MLPTFILKEDLEEGQEVKNNTNERKRPKNDQIREWAHRGSRHLRWAEARKKECVCRAKQTSTGRASDDQRTA